LNITRKYNKIVDLNISNYFENVWNWGILRGASWMMGDFLVVLKGCFGVERLRGRKYHM
jgi:hypothetical protein